ncbi:hypothetical protein KEM56_005854 [Ascosphaera pollenicola]|nr:hypothetical protein KEM56_005854 [Ascosphaera pollenicola]
MMFYSVIPPPPPRYTLPVAYAAGTVDGMPVPVLETVNVIKHPEGGCDLQVPEDLLASETYRSLARSIKRSIFRKKDTVTITITSPALSATASATGPHTGHLDQSTFTPPPASSFVPVVAAATAAMPFAPTPTVTLTNGQKVAMRKAVLTKKKKLRRRNGGGRIVEMFLDLDMDLQQGNLPGWDFQQQQTQASETAQEQEEKGQQGHLPKSRKTKSGFKNKLTPILSLRWSFLSGTYRLQDDLVLATPPPHPTEAPITSQNPLSTTPTPPTCGVKITPVYLEHSPKEPRYFPARINGTVMHPTIDTRRAQCGSQELPPVFGEGNSAMYSHDREKEKEKDKHLDTIAMGHKRRKPKSNILKSGSSFISRVLSQETAAKRLVEGRDPHGMLLFANISRAFHWLDITSKNKQDSLAKILFTKANIICHAVNELTKSPTHLDVIMGSNVSDILWYEPVTQKYSRINKNGIIAKASVNDIKWVPGSENLFIAAMGDGSLIVFDKEREDVPFQSEEIELDGAPSGAATLGMGMSDLSGASDSMGLSNASSQETSDDASPRSPGVVGFAPGTSSQGPGQGSGAFGMTSLQGSSTATMNDAATLRSKYRILKSVNSPHQSRNPVAMYKLSHMPVTSLAFSPDNSHLAVVLEDCTLRIIDFLAEEQLDIFHAYYGGINCVAWSPDGKYLVTGSQDDLVTLWSFKERRIVARCQGHTSFVRAVAFDPFSPAMVHRPKHQYHRHRNSTVTSASHYPPTLSLSLSYSLTNNYDRDAIRRGGDRRPSFTVNHPVEKRSATAQLPPILNKKVGSDPLYGIVFFEGGIMTSSLEGHIRTWDRPSTDPGTHSHAHSQYYSQTHSNSQSYPPPQAHHRTSSTDQTGGAAPNKTSTNEWSQFEGRGSVGREHRYGSSSTGQDSMHSSQISPTQTAK